MKTAYQSTLCELLFLDSFIFSHYIYLNNYQGLMVSKEAAQKRILAPMWASDNNLCDPHY